MDVVNVCFVEIKNLGYTCRFDCLYAWFSFSKGVLGILAQLDLFLLLDKTEKEDLLFGFCFHYSLVYERLLFSFKRNFFVEI